MRSSIKSLSVILAFGMLLVATTDAMAKKKRRKKKRKKADTEEMGESSYRAAYGMAGCGLGSIIFKKNNKMQILAATTNVYAFQTSAITTGTSNCKEGNAMAQLKMEQEVFVSANLNSLSKDVAQGEGRYLRAFAEVLGCSGDELFDAFADASRSNYGSIFSSNKPKDVLNNYLNVVRSDNRLSTCERVGLQG